MPGDKATRPATVTARRAVFDADMAPSLYPNPLTVTHNALINKLALEASVLALLTTIFHAAYEGASSPSPTRHSTAASSSRGSSTRLSSPSSDLIWGGQSHHRGQTESGGSTGPISGSEYEHEPSRKRYRTSYSEGTACKKPKRDPLSRPAQHFSRPVEMWCRFELIINEGQCDASDGEADDTYLHTTQRQYKRLVEICPRLSEEIRTHGVEEVATIIGRLLVSAEKVKEWDEDEEFRRRIKEGVETFRPQDYPVFLYEDDKVNPDNLLSGFLHSEILIRAYRAVMIGPSAIDGRGTSARATKKGNAQVNNMTDISIPSISYITTLVHFVMRRYQRKSTFHVGGDLGRFDYHGFYRSIADLLGDECMVQRREALLRWWKGKIFPNAHEYNEPKGDTVHGKMLAQLEASE
ncbi:hypothetical protein JB92DRAFT_3144074 [Gautieria morchelliformis]|nr:hypothetical protein JB92DRAFT_3144074 [Gautieria morchelliformis]